MPQDIDKKVKLFTKKNRGLLNSYVSTYKLPLMEAGAIDERMFSVESISVYFMDFIDYWGYVAVAVLMAMENACIPIPSELILGFAGYLIFAGKMSFGGAMLAGMTGGLAGSVFAYARPFVEKYGKYFFIKQSHVNMAQRWFDKYGIRAVFFSRMLPVIRTFISLPAGFAHVDWTKFIVYTIAGSLPWTALILFTGMMLGESWRLLMDIGHEASMIFVAVVVIIGLWLYFRRKRHNRVS